MEKTGTIYLRNVKGRCEAIWRPVDGSRNVFLCAVDLNAANNHPHIRELLIELAVVVTFNRGKAAGDGWTLREPSRCRNYFLRAPRSHLEIGRHVELAGAVAFAH